MSIILKGRIGGSDELPIQIHKFYLEEASNCFNIKISTGEKMWLQLFLWDEDNRLLFQYIHLEEKDIVRSLDILTHCTCPIQGNIEKGNYKLEVFGINSRKISYEIELEQCDLEEKKAEEMDYDIWAKGLSEEGLSLNGYEFNKNIDGQKAWYKGDFHTHTTLSDGKQTQSELMKQAEEMNLDFFVATDHNILPAKWVKGKVLVIPGMEITPISTHFNAIGLKKWIDFRVNSKDGGLATETGMIRLLKEVKKSGALCSINHPELVPWQWSNLKAPLENVDAMEIINDPTFPDNREATEKALLLWNTLWNDGYHICGIGGSDSHLLPCEKYEGADKPSVIGDPGTYVFGGLSSEEIINGVKSCNVYVSRGPKITMEISCKGQFYLPGNDLSELFMEENSEEEVSYRIKLKGIDEKCEIILVENGNAKKCISVENDKSYTVALTWIGKQYAWNRLELRNDKGELLLFTNPVYKGYKKTSLVNWGELKDKIGGN